MRKQFIPYNLAVKLKELGFNEMCIATYDEYREFSLQDFEQNYDTLPKHMILAPLWQQAFDWFREKHNLFSTIVISGADDYQVYIHDLHNRNRLYFKGMKEGYFTKVINFCYKNKDNIYEEAREACLEKLIKLCKK